MTGLKTVSILVCGEPMRGDDAVAEAIVRALPATTLGLCEVRSVGALMPDDLAVDGPVVVVDAVHGPNPGTIVDVALEDLATLFDGGVTPGSSHALPMPMVLRMASNLGGLPDGRFVGVAGDDFTLGASLSARVQHAVEPAATLLNHWIRVLAHERREVAACA